MKWGAERGSRRSCRGCVAEALEPRRLFSSGFGSLDDTFGVLGHAVAPITTASYTPVVGQVVVGSNGDIYVGGDNGIACFTAAGVPDQAYGTNGVAIYPSGTAYREAEAVDSNGLLYALTTTSTGTELVRYTAAGVIDKTYGNDGILKITADTSFQPDALAVQPDHKLVVAGLLGTSLVVFRVDADGSPDTTFASGGEFQYANFDDLPISSQPESELLSTVAGCSVVANGDILVGGGSVVEDANLDLTEAQFAVVRLTPAGALDATYGTNGISIKNYLDFTPDIADSYTVAPAVLAANADGVAMVVVPYSNETGEIVGLFSASGEPTLVNGPVPGADGAAAGAAVLPDGQEILLSGTSLTPVSPDGSLGTTTVVDTYNPSPPAFVGAPQSVAIASNGDLIVAGRPASGTGFELTAFLGGSAPAPIPEELPGATVNAITAAPDGSLYLAYHSATSNALQFVDRASGGQWSDPITVDATAGAGDFVSIASDPTSGSLIEIAYYDQSTHSLKLATSTNAGATFTTQTIDAADSVGEYPSIYINHLDLASIAFYNQAARHLQFATQNHSRQWRISTIDASRDVGRDAVMVASPSGRLSVAYSDDARGWLKLATQKSNGSWQIDKAAVAPGGAEGISLAYGGADAAAIAFYDIARHKLRVAEMTDSNGVSFSTTTVAADVGESTGISLASSSGATTPFIYAYDAADDNIQSFEAYPDATPVYYVSTMLVPGGGKYLSLTNDGGVEVGAYLDSTTSDLTVSSIA